MMMMMMMMMMMEEKDLNIAVFLDAKPCNLVHIVTNVSEKPTASIFGVEE
jgi:hypothetical protein